MFNLMNNINLIVTLPFVLVGLFFVFLALRGRARVGATKDWGVANGRILSSGVEQRRSRSSSGGTSYSWYPTVVYEYVVNGQRYMGNRLHLGSEYGLGAQSWAANRIVNYPVGGIVPVYYNPENPVESVLEKSAPANKIFLIVALVIVVIIALTTIFTTGVLGGISGFLPK